MTTVFWNEALDKTEKRYKTGLLEKQRKFRMSKDTLTRQTTVGLLSVGKRRLLNKGCWSHHIW